MSTESYPERLRRLQAGARALSAAAPGPMKGFGGLHRSAVAEGTLSASTKELMALAISIVVHCDGCIAFHVHDAMQAGATKAEFDEALGVAVLMGGGPAMVYAAEALQAYDEFVAASSGG